MDIYAQNILDRYKEPFYKDKAIKSDIHGKQVNHACGDNLEVQLELDGDKIKAYSFTGVGCAISQASADIIGDLIVGQTTDEVLNMTKDDLLEALGIEISERRMKCALLGLNAIQNAIKQYNSG
ncbi:iron-sulfur cluster assembly scaffold protein [candidate division KSB1 bacterium]